MKEMRAGVESVKDLNFMSDTTRTGYNLVLIIQTKYRFKSGLYFHDT